MSNAGVNTGFAKCFIFFMAVIILLQGGLYLGLSIWGITQRDCQNEFYDMSSNPFQFTMDIIYFMNRECGNPSVTTTDESISVTLLVDFDKAEIVQNRLYIFLITYAVISALWVITSFAIITTLCGPVTKTVNALCFWPWFLCIMAGCILDVVATGYFIHDVINTTSVQKTFHYLGISTSDKNLELLQNFDAYFITPSVIMACISSRVVLIWLLNIFGSSFCISLSNALSKRNSSKQSSVNSLATTSTAPVTSLQQQQISPIQMQEQQQQQPPQSQNQQVQQAFISSQQQSQVNRPTPLQIKRQSSISPQANRNSRPYNVQSPIVPVANMYPSAPSSNVSPVNSDATPTYRNADTHPDRLNYTTQRQTSQYQQELSPNSLLNSRYSTTNDNFQFPMQNQRVSEELRGQLPWSYTSMPPPVPKKPQLKVYPEIPTPDYGQ